MKLNNKVTADPVLTHEGAPASRINPEQMLRRSVMACLLWEDTFYEDGVEIAERIADLVRRVPAERVADLAREARKKLRHVPLLLVRTMAALPTHRHVVGQALYDVIQRPDELCEFLAIYWSKPAPGGAKQPLSAQVKKGLAAAFSKFSEYQIAKYDQDRVVKLRDVMFMVHPRPWDVNDESKVEPLARTYRDPKTGKQTPKILTRHRGTILDKLEKRQLTTPDTWEVALSGGADKRETFERLMLENRLGALAFLRNLRNMKEAGVPEAVVRAYSQVVNLDRILPFRFIAAARAVPAWEPLIEGMMLRALGEQPKLIGKTAILVDNSGSMMGTKVSEKSELDRSDAACAVAILIREICDDCLVIAFSDAPTLIPARRGFALRDAIKKSYVGGTNIQTAVDLANREGYDRIIVITDEQSHQRLLPPRGRGYVVNVSVCRNGIGYGAWTHIDGWSESVLDYIRASE